MYHSPVLKCNIFNMFWNNGPAFLAHFRCQNALIFWQQFFDSNCNIFTVQHWCLELIHQQSPLFQLYLRVAVRSGQPNFLFQSVHVDHRSSVMRFVLFIQLVYHCTCQSLWPSLCLSSYEHPNQTWGVKSHHQICKCNSIVFLCKHSFALCFFIFHQFCTCSGRQVFFCHLFNCLSIPL